MDYIQKTNEHNVEQVAYVSEKGKHLVSAFYQQWCMDQKHDTDTNTENSAETIEKK